ncbi:MAG: DUF5320 domain-containing protein [Candidatus Aenigmatarchaeota archaeon]
MPWGDGTGPWWAQGYPGWRCRRRFGFGPVFRRGVYAVLPVQITKEQEIEILKEEQEIIRQELKEIESHLQEKGMVPTQCNLFQA